MRLRKEQHLATSTDLDKLEHHEVIGGEIFEKAAPSFEHGRAQRFLSGFLHGYDSDDAGPGGWWLATEVDIELEMHEIYRPDLAGWRVERVPKPPSGHPVRIVPDWVCEVLSPSTADRDLGHKLQTYHRCGVAHHWVVDPIGQTLCVYRWDATAYIPMLTAKPGERVRPEPFVDVELDISALFRGVGPVR